MRFPEANALLSVSCASAKWATPKLDVVSVDDRPDDRPEKPAEWRPFRCSLRCFCMCAECSSSAFRRFCNSASVAMYSSTVHSERGFFASRRSSSDFSNAGMGAGSSTRLPGAPFNDERLQPQPRRSAPTTHAAIVRSWRPEADALVDGL